MSGSMGAAVSQAIALDFALRKGIEYDTDEIDIHEYAILQTLEQERGKWEQEQMKRDGDK